VKYSIALVALFIAIAVVIGLVAAGDDEAPTAGEATPSTSTSARTPGGPGTTTGPEPSALPRVVAGDPRRLGARGRAGVTFTEFLDFECEGCGAAFPLIEELRKDYAGRVTFNIRYFPLPSHRNARNAALAVEAAHRQGKLEQMYVKMYETQREWGEQSDSKAELFRGFARELGLELNAYDAAVSDPRTAGRIQRDVDAGIALGVQGTPTFFIGERRIEPQSVEDLRSEIDAALSGS
jgi:protein-disulfide isomerase